MDKLKISDCITMQKLGRWYATQNSMAALTEAAEYLASCLNEQERIRLTFWWQEGVRNVVGIGQHDYELINHTLRVRTKEVELGRQPGWSQIH